MLGVAVAAGLGGLALAYWFYVVQPGLPWMVTAQIKGLYALARDAFRVDQLYDRLIVRPLFALADLFAQRFDPGVVDGIVNGAATFVAGTSSLARRLQTGNVQHYALSFLAGAAVLVAWFVRRG
jgi:NADH-quinone oxidoreductase subunit L